MLEVDSRKAYDSVSWNLLRFLLTKMGFDDNWNNWMKSYAFSSHMSVLFNGSTTKDFKVERGFQKGDSLSPFLFVLVMEFLSGLMKKVVERGEFKGFKINKEEDVSMLRFADDAIILAEGCNENLWSMKAILREFEMMYGLKVNFHKNMLYGIHTGEWLMSAASVFLS